LSSNGVLIVNNLKLILSAGSRKLSGFPDIVLISVIIILLLTSSADSQYSLSGYVYTDSTFPNQSAAVSLVYSLNDSLISTTATNTTGFFSFVNLQPAEYHLKIEPSGIAGQWYSPYGNTVYPWYKIYTGTILNDTIGIYLKSSPINNKPSSKIVINLYDTLGNSISISAGTISLISEHDKSITFFKFDSLHNKYYLDSLQPGDYAVSLSKYPYPDQFFNTSGNTVSKQFIFPVATDDSIAFDIRLTMKPRSQGYVTGKCMSESGTPASSLTVSLYKTYDTVTPFYSTITDSRGSFYFNEIIEQNYYLKISGSSYPPQWYLSLKKFTATYPEEAIYASTAPIDTLFISVKQSPVNNLPSAQIRLFLKDTNDLFIKNARNVVLIEMQTRDSILLALDSLTWAYSAKGLATGNYAIRIAAPDYPVQYYSPSGNTQYENFYKYVVSNDSIVFNINLISGFITTNIDTTLFGYIYGIVRDSAGTPLKNVPVQIFSSSGNIAGNTLTDTAGSFGTIRVQTPHDYSVFIPAFNEYASQYWISDNSAASAGTNTLFTVTTGSSYFCNIFLRKNPSTDTQTVKTFTVTAHVKDNTDLNLKNIRVRLFPSDVYKQSFNLLNTYTQYNALTDSLGKVRFYNVPSGKYIAYASSDSLNLIGQYYPYNDYFLSTLSSTIGTSLTDLTFMLRKGGTIKGSIKTSDGKPVSSARVQANIINKNIYFETTTDSSGVYILQGLHGGSYTLSYAHNRYIVTGVLYNNQFPVSESNVTNISDIIMENGGFIRGNFTSETSLYDSLSGISTNLRGTLKLYSESSTDSNTLFKQINYTAGLFFNSLDASGISGTFISDICKTGSYRMIFTPEPVSWHKDSSFSHNGFVKTSGWSFISNALTSAPALISIVTSDTIKNLSLVNRKGYSVFGKLLDESGSAFTSVNYNIGVLKKIDNKFYCITMSNRLENGTFEFSGLVDGEEYFIEINAEGYPHQFWSGNDTNTTYINTPWKFSVSDSTIPDIILTKSPLGDSLQSKETFTTWLIPAAAGELWIKWTFPNTLQADTFKVYAADQSDRITLLTSTPRLQNITEYKYVDTRPLVSTAYYTVIAQSATVFQRSAILNYNPSSFESRLWLDVSAGKHGIQLITGYNDSLGLTVNDSVFIYKRLTGGLWKLFCKTGIYNTWLNDNSINSSDSGKTFEYKAEIPSKNLISSIKSITLDSYFHSNLSKQLIVGPYNKYTTIQSAINAAQQYDQISVKPGLYKENLNFNGKVLFLNGIWEYGTPPVLDGNGGYAITIPYSGSSMNSERTYINGLKIQNAFYGIYTEDQININNCLFTKCNTAVMSRADTLKVSSSFLANPFISGTLNTSISQCTFIASKPNDIAFSLNSPSNSTTGTQNSNLLSYPVSSVNIHADIKNSLFVYYYSRAGISSIPIKTTGIGSSVFFTYCNFYESGISFSSQGITTADINTLNPQFADTVNYFLSGTSALRTAGNGIIIGYGSQIVNYSPNRMKPISNFIRKVSGMKSVYLSWDASSADEHIAYYKISRLPADSSLFYINQKSQWDIKPDDNTQSSVMDSFITYSTYFLDTSIIPGKAYIYAVAAVDSNNNEGPIELPAPPPLSSYMVNSFQYEFKVKGGKWYMLSPWGTSGLDIPVSENHVVYKWDDTVEPDNLYSHYIMANSMSAGNGYWYKSLSDTVLTVVNPAFSDLHKQQDTLSRHLKKGKTGWNIIGSPFPFVVEPSWLSVIPVWEWNPDSSGYTRAKKLSPWNAYWIHIDKDTAFQLRTKDAMADLTKRPMSALWEIKVSLSGMQLFDPDNYCGVFSSALAKGTRMVEEPEPPQSFGSPSLFFLKNSSDSNTIASMEHLSYYYQTSDNKVQWTVGVSASDNQSTITFNGIDALPGNLHAFWVDKSNIVNLRKTAALTIPAHDKTIFGYLVVTSNPSEIALYSGQFKVKSPYPNPFRGSTVIEYVVPYLWLDNGLMSNSGRQLITMDIFDILGRHCGQIFKGNADAGAHRFVWNGYNNKNHSIASGFYLLKIRCADKSDNLKIYRLR